MKIWLVSRKGDCGYDEYDAFVAAASTEDEALRMHPSGDDRYRWEETGWSFTGTVSPSAESAWVDLSELTVVELGEAKEGQEPGVILASYNAG